MADGIVAPDHVAGGVALGTPAQRRGHRPEHAVHLGQAAPVALVRAADAAAQREGPRHRHRGAAVVRILDRARDRLAARVDRVLAEVLQRFLDVVARQVRHDGRVAGALARDQRDLLARRGNGLLLVGEGAGDRLADGEVDPGRLAGQVDGGAAAGIVAGEAGELPPFRHHFRDGIHALGQGREELLPGARCGGDGEVLLRRDEGEVAIAAHGLLDDADARLGLVAEGAGDAALARVHRHRHLARHRVEGGEGGAAVDGLAVQFHGGIEAGGERLGHRDR